MGSSEVEVRGRAAGLDPQAAVLEEPGAGPGDTATRFDPLAGTTATFPVSGKPYSYSDMTGFQQRNFTLRQGDWTVIQDSGQAGTAWNKVFWNREPQGFEPAGTSITVEVHAADTQAGLATAPWITATKGATLTGVTGRFIEVRATLRIHTGDTSPVLSEVTVVYTLATPCIEIRLSDYNLFLLEDYLDGHDVEGKVAAGGNVVMSDFSVGHMVEDAEIAHTLVVGGDLTMTRGGVHGDVWHAGTLTTDPSVIFPRGTVNEGNPIDFSAKATWMYNLSSQLAGLAANGTVTKESWGGVMLTGTDPDTNVFDVPTSHFTGATLLSISAPAGSIAVINVHGSSAFFNAFGTVFSGGINQNGVLFNFVDATSITAHGYGVWGTILAPYAHLNFYNGSFDGAIYAKSMTGNAEGHVNILIPRDICEGGNVMLASKQNR